MWNFIAWIIVGGLAGWVASMIMRTNAQMGMLANIIAGIVGALIGGWLASALFGVEKTSGAFSIRNFIIAVIGACIVIFIVKLFMRGSNREAV